MINTELRIENSEWRTNGRRHVFLNSQFSILNSPLALHTVPPEDPAVYDMICAADTIGVFQIESRAQMSMLPRLLPRCYYDLVIEVAIVRPGPIQGQMVHPYLRRRNGQEALTYPTPEIEEVLKKTLGVPLFQEQAMQLAVVAAGFTPGEADQLRRSMGAWRRTGIMDQFRAKLIEGMRQRGLSTEFAENVFEQIRGFGSYGFPESHAASFALLVYVSAWLKRYHPAAFCAGAINSQPMGFYAPAQLMQDAQRHGVTVRPVDVNYSDYDCTLEPREHVHASVSMAPVASTNNDDAGTWGTAGPALRLGLRLVKGVSRAKVEGIERARQSGPFTSVADLARRSGVRASVLARLAAADAFGSMGLTRRQALWQVLALREDKTVRPHDDPSLLDRLEVDEPPPDLPGQSLRDRVVQDYETTGLTLAAHPMSLVREHLKKIGVIDAMRLKETPAGKCVQVAGLVLIRQRPSTAKGILFFTLEDETGLSNLIVRPRIYEKYRRQAYDAVALLVQGIVERQGEVIHVQAQRMRDLSEELAGLSVHNRRFH